MICIKNDIYFRNLLFYFLKFYDKIKQKTKFLRNKKGVTMIAKEDNPEFLNDFLDYSATILNKSPNTIKEYNYDIAHFLKFIQYHTNRETVESEERHQRNSNQQHDFRNGL